MHAYIDSVGYEHCTPFKYGASCLTVYCTCITMTIVPLYGTYESKKDYIVWDEGRGRRDTFHLI